MGPPLSLRLAPETVESFSRRGDTLSGRGAGDVTITTADGCRFDAALPFRRKLPSGCTLKLRVRPRRAVAGRLTRFRFRVWVVRDGARVPVRRVRVRFAGKRKRTNRRGRTSFKLRLHKTGERRVRAKRKGFVGARAVVRVRR